MGYWVKMIVKFVMPWFQGRKELVLENLALRQQLLVLQRNTKRLQFKESDRLFWVLYSKITDGWKKVLTAVNFQEPDNGDLLSANATGLLLHPSVGEMLNEAVVIQNHEIRFATVDLGATTTEIRAQLLKVLEVSHAD